MEHVQPENDLLNEEKCADSLTNQHTFSLMLGIALFIHM